jgi:hypothetical protein
MHDKFQEYNRAIGLLTLILLAVVIIKVLDIRHLTLDGGDKDFLGAMTGALLGTLGAYIIARYTLYQERMNIKRGQDRDKLVAYSHKITEFELMINLYIAIMLKNKRLIRQCTNPSNLGNFMATLPRTYELPIRQVENLYNPYLVNEWATVHSRSVFMNQLLEDFANDYSNLSNTTLNAILTQQSVNSQYVVTRHRDIITFGESIKRSLELNLESAYHTLAVIQLFGKKAAIAIFETPDELFEFTINENEVNEYARELSETMTEDSIFTTVN